MGPTLILLLKLSLKLLVLALLFLSCIRVLMLYLKNKLPLKFGVSVPTHSFILSGAFGGTKGP